MTEQGRPKRIASTQRPDPVLSIITDLIFALIAIFLLLEYARTFLSRPASLLVLVREIFVTVYLLMALTLLAVRNSPKASTTRKADYLYTIVGFSAPLLLQPSTYGGPIFVGASFELLGLIFVASAFLSLNRSFGLAPQNRGIKTAGVYRLIRHPMYLGYILAEVGYVVDNFSSLNLLILTVSVAFLLLRLNAEERLLQQDQDYRNYSRKTRWKLLPLLF